MKVQRLWLLSTGLCFLGLLLADGAISAEPDPQRRATVLEKHVRELVEGLGAPTRIARGAAEKQLLELGPAALEHLPPPELLPTLAVRAAVARIRQELERRQARESVQPSRVTLQGSGTLSERLAELGAQTGNALDSRGLPPEILERIIALDLTEEPFWSALDQLAKRGGFQHAPHPVRRELTLKLSPVGGPPDPVVAYAGPFRVSALPAVVVERGGNPAAPVRRLVRLAASIQSEPRLRPLFAQFAAADIRAIADDQDELPPFSPEARYELPAGEGGHTTRLPLDFLLPSEGTPQRVSLKGSLRMTTAAGQAPLRFAGVGQLPDGKPAGIERRRGGVTVKLDQVRRGKDATGKNDLRVQILVAFDNGGPAFESHRNWMLHNEVFLEDPQGGRLPLNGGYETTLEGDGGWGMEYRFVELPEPLPNYSFVYVAPTLIVDVPLEFTLESVPIQPRASQP